jgi:hypothetical protein
MSGQECIYFGKKRSDESKISVDDGILYCACADIFRKNSIEIARSACPFQIGDSQQEWFMGVTYWKCGIGQDLLSGDVEDSDDAGLFAAARNYRRSIAGLLPIRRI